MLSLEQIRASNRPEKRAKAATRKKESRPLTLTLVVKDPRGHTDRHRHTYTHTLALRTRHTHARILRVRQASQGHQKVIVTHMYYLCGFKPAKTLYCAR